MAAEQLVPLEQACKELQLNRDQILSLVKQGALRGFRDQNTYKFRRADLDAYKKKTESSATLVYESGAEATEIGKGTDSKVDLADIESDAGADESDQTSVLAPVDEKDEGSKVEARPTFEFSEDELGLSSEDDASAVSGTEESDSSIDILEVTDESSSESATSAAEVEFMEESSSDEVPVTAPGEAAPKPRAKPKAADSGKAETVTDILGEAKGLGDEELETLDLDDVVADTGATVLQETPGTETAEVVDAIPLAEGPATDTAETLPVADEVETMGIAQEDATTAVGAEAEEVGTDAVAAAAEAEEEAPAAPEGVRMAGAWELVTPCTWANVCLVVGLAAGLLGGVFLLTDMISEAGGSPSSLVLSIAQSIANLFPS